MKLAKKLRVINLSNTNLSTQGFSEIVKSLHVKLESLDISRNPKIQVEAYLLLCERVLEDSHFTEFKYLNMEANLIGDQCLKVFVENISYNRSLRYLNLSHNNLTKHGAKSLQLLLLNNELIRILLLHWNNLGSQGGRLIAEALTENSTLQVLDISFC